MSVVQTPVDQLTFEESFKELEQIVRALEAADMNIDQSIALYERGLLLRKHCDEKLQQAKLRIDKILQGENGVVTSVEAPELLAP